MALNEVGNTFCNESDVFFDSHVSWMSWNRLSDSICVLYLRYLAIFIIIIIIIIIRIRLVLPSGYYLINISAG